MKCQNITLQNFKGYRNVILKELSGDGQRISVMTMELTDDKEYKDLSAIKKIRHKQNIANSSESLTITFIQGINSERILYDNMPLINGIELREAYKKFYNTKEYKTDEKSIMETYTLLASLTKRIMNGFPLNNSGNLLSSHIAMIKTLKQILDNDQNAVMCFVNNKLGSDANIRNLSTRLNKFIDKNMRIFFKC